MDAPLAVPVPGGPSAKQRAGDVGLSVEGGPGPSLPGGLPPGSSFARLAASIEEPFTWQRLLAFLAVHLAAFGSEVFSIINFWITNDKWFVAALVAPFLFSGFFCAHAAWHCEAPFFAPRVLPLKMWPTPIALLLAVPLGFFQLIIILLALEDFAAKRHHSHQLSTGGGETTGSGNSLSSPPRGPMSNKFHCKAVNGLFEGLVSSAVLLYAFWTCGYPAPPHKPITPYCWTHERTFLAILGWALMISSGLGLLELDFCTSRAIARRMRRSLKYEIIHAIFRTTEVVIRVSLYIWFMVSMRQEVWWWWLPTAADLLATLILVTVFGGAEASCCVRLLCSVPCLFANIFLFIDSPYKRRAARRLSVWLTAKNALTLVVLPGIAYFGGACPKELKGDWEMHHMMMAGAAFCVPVYWGLLWFICARSMHRHNMPDIYSACERGDVKSVRSAIRDLTHSAAVGLNVNCADTDGNTPLMLAACGGHAKVCDLLLKEGARVDVRPFEDAGRQIRQWLLISTRRRWTALHMAAWKGHAEVLRVLLQEDRNPLSSSGPHPRDADPEYFQDTEGDTPLHVAARAGKAEAAAVISTRCPAWRDVLNTRGCRPIDLARDQEVQTAITCPSATAAEPRLGSPLLLRQPSPAYPGAQPASPGAQAAANQAWSQVELPIARASREESRLVAPGLCSYVASSCGGALGRVFLANAPVHRDHHNNSVLTSISEVSQEDLEHMPLPVVQTPRTIGGGATPTGAGPHRPAGAGLAPAAGSSMIGGLPLQQEPELNIEDLEPIDRDGEPINRWSQAVQANRLSVGPLSSGRSLIKVPYEAVLGEGSYGLVWRAKSKVTYVWYAVKNIKTQRKGVPSVAARECEVAHKVYLKPHPCIVRLFHVQNFEDLGLYALVMEFCPGGDLLERVRAARESARSQGRAYSPPNPCLLWVGQVFLGLEHMHLRMETLLRDLKPDNVVLSAQGCAKLTDFGFGRFGVESDGGWSFGIPTGSPGYVAPEVLKREEYDSRADLYSLGVLVWVLLTGGLTNAKEPMPPMGRMQHGQDFQAHEKDWKLLAQCLAEPERNNARRLKDEAREFVARLTDRRPDRRLRHAEIRAHRLMTMLMLPAFDAPPAAVEQWLRSAAASTDASASAPAG